jgi:hypothetical protein
MSDDEECNTLLDLPADVALNILEFYQCPHYAPFYDKFETDESFKGLSRYFYGYFESDPNRIIYPLFPYIIMDRWYREVGDRREGETETVNVGHCFPSYAKDLLISAGGTCILSSVTQTELQSLSIGPVDSDEDEHLRELVLRNKNLKTLQVQGFYGQLTTTIIQTMQNLHELDLFFDCSFMSLDEFNLILQTCKQMRSLSICVEELEPDSIVDFSYHQNLKRLRFDSDTGNPCSFKMNQKLEYLVLQNMRLDPDSTKDLFTSNHLKKLLLYHECLDVEASSAIEKNTSLTKITCDDQNIWTNILPLIKDHPSINHLRMYMDGLPISLLYNTFLSGNSSMASRLEIMRIQWLHDPVDETLMRALITNCPKLKRLKFTSCIIQREGTLVLKDSNLQELMFDACVHLTDQVVEPIFEIKTLVLLELDTCEVTAKTAKLIAHNTTILDFSLNGDIGKEGLMEILEHNHTLERFVLEGTFVREEWLEPLSRNETLGWIGLPLEGDSWIEFYRNYPHIPHLTVTNGKFIKYQDGLWGAIKWGWAHYHRELIVGAAISFATGFLAGRLMSLRKSVFANKSS